MGLAASQARFLQLTARRTNIEYMGQQINQQRLALANASAGLFEKMLSMVPPTPPSSQDDKYFTQGYKFTDSADEIQKNIKWANWEDLATNSTFMASTAFNVSTAVYGAADYSGGGGLVTLNAYTLAHGLGNGYTTATKNGGVNGTGLVANITGANLTQTSMTVTYQDLANMTQAQTEHLATMLGIDTSKNSIGYTQAIRFVSIQHTIYNPNGQLETKTVTAPAMLEFDNLNRLLNVTLLDNGMSAQSGAGATYTNAGGGVCNITTTSAHNGGPITTLNDTDIESAGLNTPSKIIGKGESLTYAGTFDDTAYANDMNKYEFQKASYDYQIERINQETRQIQAQDKSLELKMKQLDTEHNAVQTEMEAVQKVIQKNIEGSFKTFA